MDPNFVPIGNTNLSKGSLKFKNELEWTINPDESVSFIYEVDEQSDTNYEKLLKRLTYLSNLNLNILVLIHHIPFDTKILVQQRITQKTQKNHRL